MRKIDESRAANYIRKHSNYKKWLAFVLCLSLLTGTITLYIMNKPATAMTAEGAEGLGVVLETASQADEEVLIQQTLENKAESNGNGDDDLFAGLNEDGDDNDENAGGNGDGDDLNKSGDDEETKEDLIGKETVEGEAKEGEEAKETEESKEDELTQDVVLTVSYVDEDGEAIAEEKEIDIYDSIDLTSEAPSIEGYTFKEAKFKGDVITKVVVKKNADDIRYYEVTFDGDETKEIKKDAAVVLTYIKDEEEVEVDASVTLTAKYVDKDGEDIQDSEEISFAKETSIKKDNAPEIDGYFFMKAVYDGQEIVKITPVEAETEKSDDEEETTDETKEVKTISVEGYEFTTADGDTVEITEDAEIEYTYVKASEETEFTYQDGKVTVTATINGKNVFPEGIVLKAAEVTKDSSSYNYGAYMDALNENAETIAEEAGQDEANAFTEDNTLLYDIAFVYEGKEIQPKEGTVTISINFKKNQLSEDLSAASKDDVTVVHLPIKEDVKEENEIVNTEDASDITASDIEVITLTDATAAVDGNEKVEFETEGFSIFAVLAYQKHEAGTDNYLTVLGDAVNFGIVAQHLSINGDSQTNFATNSFGQTPGQWTGNDLTNKVEQTFIASEIRTSKIQIKGEKAYFLVPSEKETEYRNIITHSNTENGLYLDAAHSEVELRGIVNDLLQYTMDASNDLKERTANCVLQKDDDRYKIDIASMGNGEPGTYYFDYTDAVAQKIQGGDDLRIYKRSNQTIVINVRTSGDTFSLKKFHLIIDGGERKDSTQFNDKTDDSVARSIIWNFIDKSEVRTESGNGVIGVFITNNKDAKWDNNATSAGWLAFPNVTINGNSEWHNTYDKIIKIGESAKFQAYKSVDDKKDHNITGFKFTLSKKVGSDWEVIESVYNGSLIKEDSSGRKIVDENGANKENDVIDPYYVNFSTLKYGDNSMLADDPYYQYVDDDSEFVYKIEETQGKTDDQGNAYFADENASVFYVKVAVTKHQWGNLSKYIYYQVSTPEYYKDEACTQKCDSAPEFKNYTAEGEVGLLIHKYLNEQVPTNQKFTFTVRVLTANNTLEPLTQNLQNDGAIISYSFKYGKDDTDGKHNINNYMVNYAGKKYLYFVITENDPPTDSGIEKDKDYIIAKVHLLNNGKDHDEVTYYKYQYDDNEGNVNGSKYIKQIEGTSTSDRKNAFTIGTNETLQNAKFKLTEDKDVAFYNKGVSMLRIHKMVVNDYSSEVVRNNVNSILNSVQFRIGYKDGSGRYIYFQGLVGKPSEMPKVTATEYPEKTKTYDVYYNQGAQWTIVGIPAGDYTVEEVGDGLTFEYDPNTDTSTVLEKPSAPLFEGWPILSRVTKYAVTVDEKAVPRGDAAEQRRDASNIQNCGIGCDNRRATFSTDVSGKVDNPVTASVGGDIETVQIANYYSSPVGQIYISKKLSGGEWTDNMSFSFKLSPVACYDITDSEGDPVVGYDTVPMPSEGGDVVTVGKADATNNMATARFGDIKYRFEGKYVYKITELAEQKVDGVTYDETIHYVVVDVNKKYTTFNKSYTYNNQTLPRRTNTTGVTEDFYYLGADITYYSDFNENSKRCEGRPILAYELYLDANLDTRSTDGAVVYKLRYPDGTPVDGNLPFEVYFENFVKGKLVVKKEWKKVDGSEDQHLAPLAVKIFRRAGNDSWKLFKEVELGTGNNWTWDSEKDLPEGEAILLQNAKGEKYQYCAREDDENITKYDVTYTYTDAKGVSIVYGTDGSDATKYKRVSTIGDQTTYTTVDRDTVALSVAGNETNYGTITITNKNIYSNALPRTGGIGDLPYLATGLGTAVVGLLGAGVYSRKKKKDDEE